MNFFRNIRIRTKIFSICFILLAIMILSGWVSFNSMTGIQANLDAIFKVRMPGIDFLIEADRDLQQLLVAERSLVFADPGGEAYKKFLKEYETNFTQSAERWEKFKALSSAPEEKPFIEGQTAAATLDIKNQIDEVQKMTELSVREIDQISSVINGVNEIVSTIAAAVEEQSAATTEISGNINQVSAGIQEVNQNINQNSSVAREITQDIAQVNDAASEISNGSRQVKLSAENLNGMAKTLNAIVSKFKV